MKSNDTNRKAALRWGGFVVGLLVLQVALGVGAIILATNDQSVAVVPDYYQKALNWDEESSRRRATERLGWTLEISELDNDLPASSLQLVLKDAAGRPVKWVSGSIEMYRHARGGDIFSRELTASDAGPEHVDWVGCVRQGGLWQISVDVVDAEGNRFVQSREVLLDGPSSGDPN